MRNTGHGRDHGATGGGLLTNDTTVEKRTLEQQLEAMTLIIATLTKLHDRLDEVHPAIVEIRTELRDHIRDENAVLQSAFPDGDGAGHKRAHEAMIRKAEAEAIEAQDRAAIWLAMRKKAAEMSVYGFIVLILAILVYYWNGHMPSSAHINLPGVK